MKQFQYLLCATLIALLSACTSPKAPTEVSEAFWQAVTTGDAKSAARLSTLVSEAAFDGFSQSWTGATVTQGRTLIDGATSQVTTHISNLPGANKSYREITTHLIKEEDEWLVDYYATQDSFNDQPIVNQLIDSFSGLSERLKSELSQHSDEAAKELDRIGEELSRKARELNQQLEPAIEDYTELLQEQLERLIDSLHQALEDHQAKASPTDKRILNETINKLEQQRENLKQTSLIAIAEATHLLAEAQLQLAELSQNFDKQKNEWRKSFEELQQELHRFLEEI